MSVVADAGAVRVRERAATAAALSAPLIVFLLIPNAVNLVTLSIIGRLGTAALAGIGIGNVIFAMLLALLFGFDTGVQAVVSRATGAGQPVAAGQALSDAMAGSALLGVVLSAVIFVFGPAAVPVLLHDAAAAAAGAAFLRGAALSVFFLSITIPFNGYWIASGVPNISFAVQVALVPVQIAATFVLVLRFGALGAGFASTAATFAGLLLQMAIARVRHVPFGRMPQLHGIGAIARIGWPISLQQSFLQFGLVLAYAVVSQLGVTAAAILNVLVSLTMLPIQSATGIGMATATLVGQALGRGEVRDAARWGWQMSVAAGLLLTPAGLFAALEPRLVLGFFLHDAGSVAAAVLPVQLLGLSIGIDAFVRVMNFALRGAGATKAATAIPFTVQWLLQLPLMWWVGVALHRGMNGVVAVQVALMFVEAAAFAFVWRRERWAAVRVGALPEAEAVVAPQRVAVLGGAGAGKSTLARAIGARLDLPVVHLDRFVFGPRWSRVAPDVARARVAAAIAEGRWVIDGTYPLFHDMTLRAADLVLWVDQPAWKRLWRAWRKAVTHRGKPRADRPDDCEEGFGLGSVWTVLRFGRWSRGLGKRLAAATPGRVMRLKGDRGVRRFLAGL